MAIQHHPLSNAKLGKYLGFDHYGKETVFQYENGVVSLTCPDSAQWKYQTHIQTEGTHYRNRPSPVIDDGYSDLECDPKHAIFKDALSYDISVVTRQEPSVQVQLDKQSIDGMDDMAFSSSSEADEASTEQKDR